MRSVVCDPFLPYNFSKTRAQPRSLVHLRSSPVSSHSSDFPNSRLIRSKTPAPISTSPRSIREKCPCVTPMRRANSACLISKPRSSRMRRPTDPQSISVLSTREARLDMAMRLGILYVCKHIGAAPSEFRMALQGSLFDCQTESGECPNQGKAHDPIPHSHRHHYPRR